MSFKEGVRETIENGKEIARDPTDEQKSLAVAILVVAIADRIVYFYGLPFVVRTTMAVGAGFIALFLASYVISGQLVPPDPEDEEDETTE